MDHGTENDDLERIAPMLSRIPRTDPFAVPEGFHDRFAQEVQARLPRTAPTPAWRRWFVPTAVALPVAALLLTGWWMWRPAPGTPANGPAIDHMSPGVAVVVWEEDLLEGLSEEDLAALAPAPDAPALTAEELADYYELTGTEVTDLIESL
ncbi:MAG TPA: hypothetical protein PKE21_07070 [Flavobacteriales bacterium]|nr:hypothetical protein [Flavobacteriales bacterium]HMR27222.1 hypothetical protein [Flavobacteriales bacterium]